MVNFPPLSRFRYLYKNGHIPVVLDYRRGARQHDLHWMVDIDKLDFEFYLPIFSDGLSDVEHPFDVLAREGTIILLTAAKDMVLSVLPEVVKGIKKALSTDDPIAMMNACAVIQRLATVSPLVGLALIRYYRILLVPVFSKYKSVQRPYKRGEIDYGQGKQNLSDVVNQTLDLLDRTGGPDAYVEIKYAVPTYDSMYHNA
ncbi:hypothetical protein JTE90_019506 [Oedothorax gibbosus]|uniref:Uncharacterized protein n=1 Tax=Oedothorax gibbosus TaxID=931172 RepID=A0AAV6VG96_9ARAC|nr:hypothetical protein JTE90_019506 [Oedothorax gibbosus]